MTASLHRHRGHTRAFVRAATTAAQLPFVPELWLRTAALVSPLWEALERQAGGTAPLPYWAFAWPGSLALARYLLDKPPIVAGRCVLDFAAGSGLAGIAAARVGAASVLAVDIDPLAAVAQRLNARLNRASLRTRTEDIVGREVTGIDVVLVGDVCYEPGPAARIVPWLRHLAADGRLVLLADPGRAYAPTEGVELLITYDVPTTVEIERDAFLRTTVSRVLPAPDHAEPGVVTSTQRWPEGSLSPANTSVGGAFLNTPG